MRELINFAEELVGKDCIVKEDSILALKTSDKRNKGKHIPMASSATDVNPLTLGDIMGVFEEIKYELIKDAKEECENDDEH